MRKPRQAQLILASVLAALALPTSARCVTDPDLAIGYFGVVPGQTARVQLVNSRSDFSCQVKVQFVGTEGQVLVTGEMVTVGPGKSTKLEIPGEALGSGRTEILPVFSFTNPNPCRSSALVSAEVVEGATVKVFYAPVSVLPPTAADRHRRDRRDRRHRYRQDGGRLVVFAPPVLRLVGHDLSSHLSGAREGRLQQLIPSLLNQNPYRSRPCEERSDEAIQEQPSGSGLLRLRLAMTAGATAF
jgi:hypothetical protein